jgi:hypothetical protein
MVYEQSHIHVRLGVTRFNARLYRLVTWWRGQSVPTASALASAGSADQSVGLSTTLELDQLVSTCVLEIWLTPVLNYIVIILFK